MPPSGALAPEARHVLVHKLREPVEAPSVSTRPTAPGPTDPFEGPKRLAECHVLSLATLYHGSAS